MLLKVKLLLSPVCRNLITINLINIYQKLIPLITRHNIEENSNPTSIPILSPNLSNSPPNIGNSYNT